MQLVSEAGTVRTMERVEEMIISNTELTEENVQTEAKRQTMLSFHDDEGNKYWVITSNPTKVIEHIGEEHLVWKKEK